MTRLLLAGACAGAILAAPALAPEASAKTLRWSFQGDIATLDPYAHTESFTANVLHHIYDPLVRRNKDLAIEPALAESWQIIEPTRWRFKLRQGVKSTPPPAPAAISRRSCAPRRSMRRRSISSSRGPIPCC